jgi:hypothetical protein
MLLSTWFLHTFLYNEQKAIAGLHSITQTEFCTGILGGDRHSIYAVDRHAT